jgi:hypothetical protein
LLPPFTVPTATPVTLPAGWQRLRLIVPEQLSENYQVFVEEGRQRLFRIGVDDRRLWEPAPLRTAYWAGSTVLAPDLDGDGIPDLILPYALGDVVGAVERFRLGVAAVSGRSGQIVWRHEEPEKKLG